MLTARLYPGPMLGVRYGVPYNVTYPTMHLMLPSTTTPPPPTNKQTPVKTLLPQTLYAAGNYNTWAII